MPRINRRKIPVLRSGGARLTRPGSSKAFRAAGPQAPHAAMNGARPLAEPPRRSMEHAGKRVLKNFLSECGNRDAAAA